MPSNQYIHTRMSRVKGQLLDAKAAAWIARNPKGLWWLVDRVAEGTPKAGVKVMLREEGYRCDAGVLNHLYGLALVIASQRPTSRVYREYNEQSHRRVS